LERVKIRSLQSSPQKNFGVALAVLGLGVATFEAARILIASPHRMQAKSLLTIRRQTGKTSRRGRRGTVPAICGTVRPHNIDPGAILFKWSREAA